MTLEELKEKFPLGCKVMYNGREETVVGHCPSDIGSEGSLVLVSCPGGWDFLGLPLVHMSNCDMSFKGGVQWARPREVTRIDTPTCNVDDKVVFKMGKEKLTYKVGLNHLYINSGYNATVFTLLGLDKYDFCSKAYGYPHKGGDWPSFHDGDMQAAQRVIDALHEECRKFNERLEKPKETPSVESYEALPVPDGLDVVYLEVVKDIVPEKLINGLERRGALMAVIPKGSRSWICKNRLNGHPDLCCPENNRWGANIPKEYFKEVTPVAKTEEKSVPEPQTAIDMKAIQEECRRRYPIGCRYRCASGDGQIEDLQSDAITYTVTSSQDKVMAHSLGGYLYYKGRWAELVSLPETTMSADEPMERVTEGSLQAPVPLKRLVPPIIINK